jgi:hypothetical protein
MRITRRLRVIDLDIPRHLSSTVCRIAGIEATTLRNWMRPPEPAIILGVHDRAAIATGSVHLFTGRRLMQAAMTADLCRLGLAPRRAGMASVFFTDSGIGRRKPCELFPAPDETFLIVRGGEQFDVEIVKVKAGQVPSNVLLGRTATAVIALSINRIYDRVLEELSELETAPEEIEERVR